MVDKQVAKTIDEAITRTQKFLSGMPEPVRTRTVTLKAYPDEVIKRIRQIDGVVIEFEERG